MTTGPLSASYDQRGAPERAEAPVRVETLDLAFGDRTVLREVSLAFPRGSITAILGPTGSGKTTLLRTLNRMNDRLSGFRHHGDVFVNGVSIWAPDFDRRLLRRQVGMLFQRPNPFPMSILDNVLAGVKAHRLAPRRAWPHIGEDRLRQVGLWDAVVGRLKESPFRLSGGQQQLLCLARALAVQPDVLLLDEPTSSLDPASTAAVESMIRGLAPALTVIVVTHNLAQARRIADRAAFFSQGTLLEHGVAHAVLNAPQRPETAAYMQDHG